MKLFAILALTIGLLTTAAAPQTASAGNTVTADVKLAPADRQRAPKDMSETVLWLVPVGDDFTPATVNDKHFRMAQKDKRFEPSLLVVPLGSYVDFPNLDPWFHNVFSLFQGKRFDLGLYQAGAQKAVRFEKPGVSYLFCNIHPEMSAVILSVESRWYGISDRNGHVSISAVPNGKYQVHAWREDAVAGSLKAADRVIEVGGDRSLGTITLTVQPGTHGHKNKYGKDYDSDALKPDY
jgi:plastocyanin